MDYIPNQLHGQLEKLAIEPIDPSKLPYDSIYAARLRMIYDHTHKCGYDSIDRILVLGDQTQGVSLYLDPEQMKKRYFEHNERKREFLRIVDSSLKSRHEEYLKKGRYNEVLDLIQDPYKFPAA